MAEGPDETELKGVPRAMLWIASVALAAMMLVVVADVLLRFTINKPVRGSYDMVSIGLLVMVVFGIAPVIARKGEILIDLIDPLLTRRMLHGLGLITIFGTLALFVFLGWAMIGPAIDAWKWGGYSLELGLPVWTLWAVAFIGMAGILWTVVVRLIRTLRGEGDDGPHPTEEGAL
ncbi:TRAP transporter small permease [Paracoccus aurantiacus]|uniref:TRAP transporter small permease protein n=1 Tax=Paracoccus aurantiacus TaxID=2599412 RepID=A0A5C6RZP8_9RHOB|nr:TRAP transporter small permease [Paracoccus aurantiacus]TXB67445.1 TRAP transporter small permease [Paracoccus aurantiacus]